MKSRDIYEHVTNRIVTLLEKAQIPSYKMQWLNIQSGTPMNVCSGNNYRGINTLLLNMDAFEKNFNLNRWLSFNQAASLGGKVKKGEKSSMVILYKLTYFDINGNRWTPQEVERFNEAERNAMQLTSKSFLTIFNVFNVAQVEGLPAKYYMQQSNSLTEFERDERAEHILNASGATIQYGGNDAFYHPTFDKIQLPTREQFTSAEGFYCVAFHELGHWTGHPSRLNREKESGERSAYAIEELVAELTAAYVLNTLGYQKLITNNAAYLKSWIAALKQDPKIIFTVSRLAQSAADVILKPLEKYKKEAA